MEYLIVASLFRSGSISPRLGEEFCGNISLRIRQCQAGECEWQIHWSSSPKHGNVNCFIYSNPMSMTHTINANNCLEQKFRRTTEMWLHFRGGRRSTRGQCKDSDRADQTESVWLVTVHTLYTTSNCLNWTKSISAMSLHRSWPDTNRLGAISGVRSAKWVSMRDHTTTWTLLRKHNGNFHLRFTTHFHLILCISEQHIPFTYSFKIIVWHLAFLEMLANRMQSRNLFWNFCDQSSTCYQLCIHRHRHPFV